MNSIEIVNVSKEYKNGVKGLDNVSFTIGSGVFGLLGHNGAGKTTLMRSIATIIRPTNGTIEVLGCDIVKKGNEVRKHIGYLPQDLNMYPNLTVFEFISYMAKLKGTYSKRKVEYILEEVDMLDCAKRYIGGLSGGMKRRVGIAMALVGNPDILIVDEPTAGLDPEERVRFRSVLSRFSRDNRTVILSTHIVEDVYQLCEKIAVLRKGKLFFAGDANDLMRQVHNKIKVLELESEYDLVELQKKTVILSTNYEKNFIKVRIMDDNNLFQTVPVSETLEDAYIYCMGGKSHA